MQIQKAGEASSTKSSGWSNFPPTQFPSDSDLHFSSPNVQAWSVGNTMQLKVVKQLKAFFKDNEDDDDSDYDSGDEEGFSNVDYSGFFSKLFQENKELRDFYEKNHDNGEFGCLVCGGVGFIRRFKDCVALVQHTVTISKTKKMKAHRAFGLVVCEVLGWDINKLPSVSVREKKNATSTKSGEENVCNEADKETLQNESASVEHLPANGSSAVPESKGDGSSVSTKLVESAPGIEQEAIEGSLDCVEASPDNGIKYFGGNADFSSVNEKSASETKGKDATGGEMLPTTDISNLAQSLESLSGVGRNPNYLLKETLDREQDNAESSSNFVEPRKEDGSGENESEDN